MFNEAKQIDVDLWEVWIEYDPSHPKFFGTLYIHGEVPVEKKLSCSLTKLKLNNSDQLILQLPPISPLSYHTKEVCYSEPIYNLNQYSSVHVYAGNELIASFDNIEVMI